MKTVYDLHRFWTSMSAIFGSTFHIGRMTKFLLQIYIELTGSCMGRASFSIIFFLDKFYEPSLLKYM